MKCTIPEISWHNREPVLSVDIHPLSCEFYRLASGGGDSHVLIWQMTISNNGAVKQDVIADLTRHQKAVNVVRWSPTGQYLASADDDANIIIWQLKNDNIPLLEGDTGDKEIWIVYKVLRGHKEDIYDLCWSVSSLKILSGSVDNTAILWDISKGKLEHILTDHKGFVQGVTWDPKNELISTISTDRICRLFDTSGKHIKARIHKGKLPVPSVHFLYNKEIKYFYDDTFKSFFRRLQFSPDGSILVVPSGHMESEDSKRILNATLMFTIDNLTEPAAILPLCKQCSTCVRFCPILFELRDDGPNSLLKLPYRMIFAVGTDHDVILYDTQQSVPFARFHEIHYTRLTDLTWSNDGLLLVASSTDGFCALITFEPGELGVPYTKEEIVSEDNLLNISGIEELDKDENIDINNKELKMKELEKKKPSFLEKWATNTSKRIKPGKEIMKSNVTSEVIEIKDDDDDYPDKTKEMKADIEKSDTEKNSPGTLEKNETKKKPAFLEQWAMNKHKDIKLDSKAVNDNKSDGKVEMIENDENNQALPQTIKDEIIKLIPSRSQTVCINTCNDNVKAKPIEVRRKPRVIETSNETIKCTSTNTQIMKVTDSCKELSEDKMNIENAKVLSQEIKNQINELIPRRSAVNTLHKTENKIDAKPIEIRRQPRNTGNISVINKEDHEKHIADKEVVQTVDKNNADNSRIITQEIKIEINKLIPRRSDKNENSHKFEEGNNSKKDLEAKPIAVRRKPREVLASFLTDIKDTRNDSSTIKSLESTVDHKNDSKLNLTPSESIQEQEITTNEQFTGNYDQSNIEQCSLSSKNVDNKLTQENTAKEIDVKDKMQETIEIEDTSKESTEKTRVATVKRRSIDKDSKKVKHQSFLKIKLKNNFGDKSPQNKPANLNKTSPGQRKNEKTPKGKTGSSARKKLPPQNNSLLNFLNSPSNKLNKIRTDNKCIDLTITEDDEARGGWDEERSVKKCGNSPELEPMAVDEDCTEDFCLQLEESQDEKQKITDKCLVTETEMTHSSNISNSSSSTSTDCNPPKKPRKVPFTTLASPQGKKKQKNEMS